MAMTAEDIEREIKELQASPEVKLIRKYNHVLNKRRDYLYSLRNLKKQGAALMEQGITSEMIDEMAEELK